MIFIIIFTLNACFQFGGKVAGSRRQQGRCGSTFRAPGLLPAFLHHAPRPSAVAGDAAWHRQSPQGSCGSHVWKKLGGKNHTLLSPGTPKSGPSPVGEGSAVYIFLAKHFWVAQAMGRSWKQAREMVSAHPWLLPRNCPIWLVQQHSCSKIVPAGSFIPVPLGKALTASFPGNKLPAPSRQHLGR